VSGRLAGFWTYSDNLTVCLGYHEYNTLKYVVTIAFYMSVLHLIQHCALDAPLLHNLRMSLTKSLLLLMAIIGCHCIYFIIYIYYIYLLYIFIIIYVSYIFGYHCIYFIQNAFHVSCARNYSKKCTSGMVCHVEFSSEYSYLKSTNLSFFLKGSMYSNYYEH